MTPLPMTGAIASLVLTLAATGAEANKVYVSNEEKSILDAMRELRNRAVELRGDLETIESPNERRRIEAELAKLRERRSDLAIRREQAYKRKMIMLGHLPLLRAA